MTETTGVPGEYLSEYDRINQGASRVLRGYLRGYGQENQVRCWLPGTLECICRKAGIRSTWYLTTEPSIVVTAERNYREIREVSCRVGVRLCFIVYRDVFSRVICTLGVTRARRVSTRTCRVCRLVPGFLWYPSSDEKDHLVGFDTWVTSPQYTPHYTHPSVTAVHG